MELQVWYRSWQVFQAWHTRWEGLPFWPGLSYSEATQSILYNLANAISWQITTGSQCVKGFPFAVIYFHHSLCVWTMSLLVFCYLTFHTNPYIMKYQQERTTSNEICCKIFQLTWRCATFVYGLFPNNFSYRWNLKRESWEYTTKWSGHYSDAFFPWKFKWSLQATDNC